MFGGSDTIINKNSLFSTYNNVNTNDVRELLENPKFVAGIVKGTMPLYHSERYQRYVQGLMKREKIHQE